MELITGTEDGHAVEMSDEEVNRIIEAEIFDEDELPDEWFRNL